MKKELRQVAKALEAQGFTTSITRAGHLRVFKDGRQVTTFSGTPSDNRSWRNSLAAARRAGFHWPHWSPAGAGLARPAPTTPKEPRSP